ncbi:hypothetical protein QAD02_004369 [Eretmocerus hayati]|uniref:Uncharacterized protein n=1 Tax=Eretmocerus hayati TaxID=131215 RepID=A0ACC2NQF9_9HYME|nr:hypothetical protein QAD02_004369 [Eretmocerus hayati]
MANEQYGYFWGGEQRPIEVDDDVELLRRDFERMSLATAQRFERVDGALLGLDARMNEITMAVDGIIIPKINDLVNFISEQDVRMNGIGARMDVDFSGVNERIDRMEMDIAEMAPRMNLIEDRVWGVELRLAGLEARMTGHVEQIDGRIDRALGEMNEKIDRAIEEMSTKIDNINFEKKLHRGSRFQQQDFNGGWTSAAGAAGSSHEGQSPLGEFWYSRDKKKRRGGQEPHPTLHVCEVQPLRFNSSVSPLLSSIFIWEYAYIIQEYIEWNFSRDIPIRS